MSINLHGCHTEVRTECIGATLNEKVSYKSPLRRQSFNPDTNKKIKIAYNYLKMMYVV